MDIREIFAGRIIDLRNKRGLTQAEVAQSIGISRQSVTLYESQQRVPDIAVLRKFSEFFGVTSDYLIGLSDNKNAENAATGHELGLSDKAIENLKNYKILRDSLVWYEDNEMYKKISEVDELGHRNYSFWYDIDPKIIDEYPELAPIIRNMHIGNDVSQIMDNALAINTAVNAVLGDYKLALYIGMYLIELFSNIDQVAYHWNGAYLIQHDTGEQITAEDIGRYCRDQRDAIWIDRIKNRLQNIRENNSNEYSILRDMFGKKGIREIFEYAIEPITKEQEENNAEEN